MTDTTTRTNETIERTKPVKKELPAPRTGAHAIWHALVEEGVEVVFGYPGGAIMPAYDTLIDYPLHHVLVRHEQNAAHMADGYARAGHRVGIAVATSGPGATNLVTGIATAMLDSIPIVCITGQVGAGFLGSDAFQEVDIVGVTLPITKHNYQVTDPDEIIPTIKEAIRLATSGRPGPVVVDITKDAQQNPCRAQKKPRPVPKRYSRKQMDAPRYDLERALELLEDAKRPVILAGHGIIKANATDALLQLVERIDCPVACTLLGLGGFPANHPRALGMMGMHGEAWVNEAIQQADLLVALGMRFDDRVTGTLGTYAPHARKIHVERDPAEIDKNVKVDAALVGDVADALGDFLERLKPAKREQWTAHIDSLKGDSAVRDIQSLPDDGELHAAHVIHDLYRVTEGRALVVTDVGQHQMWEAQYYRHDHPRKLLTSGGLGTMGFALPAAIGARFACPDDDIWVIAGDGGFQMTACELSTCVQENLNVNIAIINNGYLGMVRQWQEMFYERRYVSTPIVSPDFVKLAEAHGLLGLRVTKRDEVEDAVARARAHQGTTLIDFRVHQEDSVYPMVPSGAALNEMLRRPASEKKNPIYETGED